MRKITLVPLLVAGAVSNAHAGVVGQYAGIHLSGSLISNNVNFILDHFFRRSQEITKARYIII